MSYKKAGLVVQVITIMVCGSLHASQTPQKKSNAERLEQKNGHDMNGSDDIDLEYSDLGLPKPDFSAFDIKPFVIASSSTAAGAGSSSSCKNSPHVIKSIFKAAKNGDFRTVKNALDKQVIDINSCDSFGETLLLKSSRHGHEDIVRLALESKAEVDHVNNHSNSPLYCATLGGHSECLGLLIKSGAKINSPNKVGNFPLDVALEKSPKCARVLFENGASSDRVKRDNKNKPVLCSLVREKEERCAKIDMTLQELNVSEPLILQLVSEYESVGGPSATDKLKRLLMLRK
ncbi:MAG: ankyrin repeat domain-containing protein [Candidatus Dependentiae bacterium]|nr:ankyrin repeat domain-containing protein [Candidatus Dependentiae bacterium]